MFADLHIHSWYSDGTMTPGEIIEKAKAENVTLISICDHECVEAAVKFLNLGINGFECYYPAHADQETEFLVKFCKEHDLIITAGSDEHGGFNSSENYIGVIKIKTEQLNLKDMV